MSRYLRPRLLGCPIFFTVALAARGGAMMVDHVHLLRALVAQTRAERPFGIDAWVVLPEHMHCVWTLPPVDADYPLRWRLIKTFFCRGLPSDEYRSLTRLRRGERGIWQPGKADQLRNPVRRINSVTR